MLHIKWKFKISYKNIQRFIYLSITQKFIDLLSWKKIWNLFILSSNVPLELKIEKRNITVMQIYIHTSLTTLLPAFNNTLKNNFYGQGFFCNCFFMILKILKSLELLENGGTKMNLEKSKKLHVGCYMTVAKESFYPKLVIWIL